MFNHLDEDNMQAQIQRDTKAWQMQVWVSFGLAAFLCGVGLAYLPGKDLDRAFMVMGYIFCLSAAFVLAKFIRDNQDPNATNQADSVQIESFSHLRDSVHLHHGSALVAYDGNVRMMDDATTHSRYFYNKALDYGTPCPQMCDLFEMEHKGEEVLGTSCP